MHLRVYITASLESKTLLAAPGRRGGSKSYESYFPSNRVMLRYTMKLAFQKNWSNVGARHGHRTREPPAQRSGETGVVASANSDAGSIGSLTRQAAVTAAPLRWPLCVMICPLCRRNPRCCLSSKTCFKALTSCNVGGSAIDYWSTKPPGRKPLLACSVAREIQGELGLSVTTSAG